MADSASTVRYPYTHYARPQGPRDIPCWPSDWGSCRPLFAWPALSPHGHGGPVTPPLSQLEERSRPCRGPSRLSEDAEARGNFEAGSGAGYRGRGRGRRLPVLWPATGSCGLGRRSFFLPPGSKCGPRGLYPSTRRRHWRRNIICAGSSRKKNKLSKAPHEEKRDWLTT